MYKESCYLTVFVLFKKKRPILCVKEHVMQKVHR